jgi:uncharacterized membrane protein
MMETTSAAPVASLEHARVVARAAAPDPAAIALWVLLIGLAALGVVSVALRWAFPDDAALRLEGLREAILAIVHGKQPVPASRFAELAQFDGRFRDHRLMTLGHILAGGAFVLLAPLQLATPIRERFPAVHRWTGRALIVLAVVGGATALFFGLGMPFGGPGEAAAIALVGAWLFTSLARGYLAIRRGDRVRHREWMLRMVGACIGVSVVRVVGVTTDLTLTPNGLGAPDAFVIALWTGWAATFAVTEWWIRRTR